MPGAFLYVLKPTFANVYGLLERMFHLSLLACTVAAYNFLSANLLCSAMSLLFLHLLCHGGWTVLDQVEYP